MHWSEEELQIPIVPGAVHSEGRREGEKVQPPPVFDLDFGRVSILSCFDINYPELWMHLSARGVDIVFWPSMYPAGGLLKSIARVFHLYIISSVRLEYAPPQLVDLVGRTIIPEILNKDNAVDDWLAYIVTLDLSKQLMHADMLHGWGQISDLKKNLEKYEVTHLDEAEQWFIQSRWSKQKCRLPNTVRNSTQVAVCGEGGLKDFIRRSRVDINSRRGIQPSKFSQSQHRKMSKEALEMDRTVLSPSEFTKACADSSSDSICSILALLSSPMPDVNDAIPKETERFEGLATEELSGTGGETIQELAVLSSDFPAHLLASQSEPHSFFPPPRTNDPQQEIGSGWEASFNVTVVLNPWHRPQLFQMQLKALHEQTFRISQIWVVLSASPKHSAFVDIMQSSCATWNMTCYHVNSDYNFVYYMPWQAALQATTRYVWFLDDDVLPGRHALAFLLHVSNTLLYRDALLGGRGSCVWPGLLSHPDFLIRRGSTYREGVEYCDAPAMRIIRESENLDGSRFMLQKHIKLLFREEPGNGMPDWRDNDGIQQGKWLSNDMQLTYVLRKYAGRRSFVLPCAGFPQMCIDGDSLLGKEGMTTVGSRVLIRREYIHRMFMRGADQVWTQRLRQARRRSVMVFAHSVAHAYTMASVRRELEKQGATHVYVTISGHMTQKGFGSVSPEDGVAEEELFKIFGFTQDDLMDQRVGFFSLKIGLDFPREHSPAATLADSLFHFQEVLKSTRPSLVCLPLTRKHEVAPGTRRQMETESAAVRGAELAAEYTQVPVVWIVSETSEDVVKAKVTAMEYQTLAEEAKTTAQQLKNGQSGDGKQSSASAHGMNFSGSQSSASEVSTNRPKKRSDGASTEQAPQKQLADIQKQLADIQKQLDEREKQLAERDKQLADTQEQLAKLAEGHTTLATMSNRPLPPVVAGSATALASVYDTHHESQGPEDDRDLLAEYNYKSKRKASRISGATYSIRPLRPHQGAELCRFYDHGLGNQSRFMFSPLSADHRDAADIHKCADIAAAASLRQSICKDADEEGLQTCHDAARAGMRFDLVLMQRVDRERAQHEEDFIYGWAFWGDARQSGDARERYIGIAIADALQGKGFGKKMMHALIRAAEAVTFITTLRLNVRSNNSRAVALYEAFGFQHDNDNHPFLAVDDVVLQKMRLALPSTLAEEARTTAQLKNGQSGDGIYICIICMYVCTYVCMYVHTTS